MDEEPEDDYELISPKAAELPPMKRLWVAPPEPEEVSDSPTPPKKKKVGAEAPASSPVVKIKKTKKKVEEEVIDDGTGAIKLEATPTLDTYESRQRVRWIVSSILVAIGMLGLFVVLKAFKGSGVSEEARTDVEVPESITAKDSRAAAEREAGIVLDMAKQAEKNGKTKVALEQLGKLTKTYSATAAGRQAAHALERFKREQTLFGEDEPTIAAVGPKPTPPETGTKVGPVVLKAGGGSNANPNPGTTPAPPPPPPQPLVTQKIPPFYRPDFSHPIHPSGWPTRLIGDLDDAELVLVPASTFIMGRDDTENREEGPAHEVFVSTYYIDLHEVTVGQYLRFLKESGRSVDPKKLVVAGGPIAENLPVVNISWNDAKAYCTWAKRQLPTEAQWELAARGPTGRISYWNEELPRKDPEKGDRKMEPVMSLATDLSPYEAFDLGANAWEWTSEYYDSKYYKQFHALAEDPTGPKDPLARIGLATVKGGSSRGILTWRKGLKLETKDPKLGFRGSLRAVPPKVIAPPPPSNTGPLIKGGSGQPF